MVTVHLNSLPKRSARCWAPAGGGLRVLDLGCGTGLGGEALRPYASLLVGVDLSPDMLKQASRRAFYDGLCEAELTSYCLLQPDRYDLVVAADTLCYFGRLDDVFAAAAFALAAAGWFVFTVEEADGDAVAGYQLNVHGRYSHHRDDVTRWLNAAGFHPHLMRHATLRHELGAEVAGLVVAARRV
ncbi:MAG: methyltransferase domain-containing protein [Rhodospirillales bacterium]|nr:methyltransferase domain-containing protein [Rhodospirillales bacterium]